MSYILAEFFLARAENPGNLWEDDLHLFYHLALLGAKELPCTLGNRAGREVRSGATMKLRDPVGEPSNSMVVVEFSFFSRPARPSHKLDWRTETL